MLRAIIIDDEEIGINTLKVLIERVSSIIKVVAIATEPEKGISLIEDYKPDVVFLDVNMPRLSGFELLENLKYKGFKLIFTTAHRDHAIRAIKSKALDYLLKPIDVEDLKRCINTILESFGQEKIEAKPSYGNIIELSVKNGIILIKTSEIIRLEADRSYMIFHLFNNVKHVASKSLKEYEQFLDPDTFYRCHPSHIINLRMATRIVSEDGLYVQMIDGSKPSLLKRNKQGFLDKLKNL